MNSSAQPTGSAEGPQAWHKILVAVLALAFFLSPYLYTSPQNPTDAVGSELVGDGLLLVTGHPAQVAAQKGFGNLPGTLTSTWWGGMAEGQALYRPIPSLLLGLAGAAGGVYDESAPGDRTFPYHAIMLGLNVLCSLLVLELAWLLFKNAKVALIAGALFATLPIHGEAIFDVAGIAELCAAAFSLAAWAAWIRAGDNPLSNMGQFAIALLCLFLATMSKESAFALPLVFFLADIGRAPGGGGFGAGLSHAFSKIAPLVVCAVVLGVSLLIRQQVTGELFPTYLAAHTLDNPLLADNVGFMTRAMNSIRLMGAGALSIFGINTLSSNWNYSPDYSANQISIFGAFELWNLIGLVGVAGSIALAVLAFKKCQRRAALVFALFGAMLVTSNLISPVGTIYADRLMLFPSVIAVMFLAGFLAKLGQAGVIAGLVLSLGGGFWTWTNGSNFWGSQTDLWTYAAEKAAPNSARAHFNNAVDASKDQVYQLARKDFERAIEIQPKYAQAHAYLGNIYTLPQMYDLHLAIQHYVAACESQLEDYNYSGYPSEPDLASDSYGPRALLWRLNRLRLFEEESRDPEGQLAWLDSIIAKGYNSAYVHHRRASALAVLGRNDEAEAAFEKSLAIETTRDCALAYGKRLLDTGRAAEALTLYRSIDTFSAASDQVVFLLARGEAEFEDGAEAVLALADKIWGMKLAMEQSGEYLFTDEQVFQTLYLRARAKSLIYGQNPSVEQLQELTKILQSALGSWKVPTATTYAASSLMSQYLLALGQDEDARVIVTALLNQRETPSLRYQLGGIYQRQGRLVDALDQFERVDANLAQAAILFPDNPSYLQHLLTTRTTVLDILRTLDREDDAHLAIGRWHEAAETEFDPNALYVQAYWQLGTGDIDGAYSNADLLVQQFPDNPLGAGLVNDIRQLKDLELRASTGSDPAECQQLAELRRRLKDGEGALEMARRAVELSGDSAPRERASRLSLLAACFEMTSNLEGALESNKKALELELTDEDKAFIQADITRLETLLTQ